LSLGKGFEEALKKAALEAVVRVNKEFEDVEKVNEEYARRGVHKSEWEYRELEDVFEEFSEAMRRSIDPNAFCYRFAYDMTSSSRRVALITCRIPSRKVDVVISVPVEKFHGLLDYEYYGLESTPVLMYSLKLGEKVGVSEVKKV
jgi:hypothetical protein